MALDTFTKAMRLTPKEAAKSIKSLVNIADSLGVEAAKVATNFEKVGPDIVQFGDNAIDVFARLQAQSAATGLEVSKLANFAKSLDTFEGAAQKAQMLNAVLGGTFLSVTDLVHADFPDKVTMIQEAMANAGIEFETADRRMKQVITNALGLESVGEAAKFLTNKEEAEEFAESVDTTAMSQDDLKVRINEGLTAAEHMTKSMSSLAGGVTKFNKRIKVAAADASGIMVGTFGQILDKTKESETALMGLVGALIGIDIGAGALGKLGETVLGGAAGHMNAARAALMASTPLKVAAATGAIGVAAKITEGMVYEPPTKPTVTEGGFETPAGFAWTKDLLERFDDLTETPPGSELMKDLLKSLDDLYAVLKDQEITVQVESVLDGDKVGESVAGTVIKIHEAERERQHTTAILAGG